MENSTCVSRSSKQKVYKRLLKSAAISFEFVCLSNEKILVEKKMWTCLNAFCIILNKNQKNAVNVFHIACTVML